MWGFIQPFRWWNLYFRRFFMSENVLLWLDIFCNRLSMDSRLDSNDSECWIKSLWSVSLTRSKMHNWPYFIINYTDWMCLRVLIGQSNLYQRQRMRSKILRLILWWFMCALWNRNGQLLFWFYSMESSRNWLYDQLRFEWISTLCREQSWPFLMFRVRWLPIIFFLRRSQLLWLPSRSWLMLLRLRI